MWKKKDRNVFFVNSVNAFGNKQSFLLDGMLKIYMDEHSLLFEK